MSTMHGLPGIPEEAETIALMRDLLLVQKQECVRTLLAYLVRNRLR